uniref:Microbial-type PARG catalytic domain-containing protein n=1 Tax=Mycena chlorophos TaxID=658473 RepID=A0ABQ0M4E1_MYCCL|nr:predicted protein [Mycena chlorophos]
MIRRQPSFFKQPREDLQEIARTTLAAVVRGSYHTDFDEVDRAHPFPDLSAVPDATRYFPEDASADWPSVKQLPKTVATELVLYRGSTLEALRLCFSVEPQWNGPSQPCPTILNFASATSPGGECCSQILSAVSYFAPGGFLHGSRAQEETLARSSNLYSSLSSKMAAPFYAPHDTQLDPRYSHGMGLTRGVRFVRDDAGTWVVPADADVLTSAAVNVRALRTSLQESGKMDRGEDTPLPPAVVSDVHNVMRERMSRILYTLYRTGATDIVLGSFGTGSFGNNPEFVARTWAELLFAGEGVSPFWDLFRTVVFAVIDQSTFAVFQQVFARMGLLQA